MKTKNIVIPFSLVLMLGFSSAFACSSTAPLRQGIAFANMNDFQSAINEFRASIKCKKSAKAYSNLGVAYLQIGKNNLALEALKKAESLNKKDNIVLYNLAAAYSLNSSTDLSLVYLDRALENGFNNYDAIRFDPDLGEVRGEPEFRNMLEKHRVFIQ